jgi:hypothetical protein
LQIYIKDAQDRSGEGRAPQLDNSWTHDKIILRESHSWELRSLNSKESILGDEIFFKIAMEGIAYTAMKCKLDELSKSVNLDRTYMMVLKPFYKIEIISNLTWIMQEWPQEAKG